MLADWQGSCCGLRGHISSRPGGSRMRSFVLVLGAGIFAIVPGSAQDAASGEKIFVQCKACHQIGENERTAVGPVPTGWFGRKPGRLEAFSYPPATRSPEAPWYEPTSSDN